MPLGTPCTGTNCHSGMGRRLQAGLLHTLWRSGILEVDASTILPSNLSFLIQSAAISGKLAPIMAPARPDETDSDALLTIGQLEFAADFGTQIDIYGMNISTGADVVFMNDAMTLIIDPNLKLEIWSISSTGEAAMFEADALKQLIEAEFWPTLTEALDQNLSIPMPSFEFGLGSIAPTLSDFSPSLVEVRPIELRDGYLIFDGNLEGSVDLTE